MQNIISLITNFWFSKKAERKNIKNNFNKFIEAYGFTPRTSKYTKILKKLNSGGKNFNCKNSDYFIPDKMSSSINEEEVDLVDVLKNYDVKYVLILEKDSDFLNSENQIEMNIGVRLKTILSKHQTPLNVPTTSTSNSDKTLPPAVSQFASIKILQTLSEGLKNLKKKNPQSSGPNEVFNLIKERIDSLNADVGHSFTVKEDESPKHNDDDDDDDNKLIVISTHIGKAIITSNDNQESILKKICETLIDEGVGQALIEKVKSDQ